MKKITTAGLLSVLTVFVFVLSAQASELRVIDGDTIVLDGERHRLVGYDTPEIKQTCKNSDMNKEVWPAGRLAKERLIELIGDKEVTCVSDKKDRYGRHLSTCYVDGVDLNEIMVKEGWGFVSPRYEQTYIEIQIQAKEQNIGVWKHNCEYPWDFRHLKKRFNEKAKAQ